MVARKVSYCGEVPTLPSACGRHLPWEGRLLLYRPSKAPLPGELDAPQAQTEGSCYRTLRTFRDAPRAACRPPLHPMADPQNCAKCPACQKVRTAGSRPRPTNCRKQRIFAVHVPANRRGGLQTAREVCSRYAVLRDNRPFPATPPRLSGPQARDPPYLLSIIFYLFSFSRFPARSASRRPP